MNTKREAATPLPPLEHQADHEAWDHAANVGSVRDELRDHFAADLGQRLRIARQGMNRTTLAELMGLHENTVGKFERGVNIPDAFQLRLLAHMLDVSLLWLLGVGDDEPAVGRSWRHATEARDEDGQVFVPHFDVSASAGHGAFDQVESVKAMRAFTSDYLRHDLGIHHDHLAIVNVVGSSMEPSIHSGDVVLVDREDNSVSVEGAYLVRVDGALLVKILQRLPGGRIRVASENDQYPPFEVDINKDGRDFQVLGRVRWAGVTFR